MRDAVTAHATIDPVHQPVSEGLTRSGVTRLDAVDMLRGLVIAIMVLDHVRDFVQIGGIDATDPAASYPALYLTRWVTHLCAPTFVFLAGLSIFFQRANGKTGATLARFLATRGLWLILLETTIISFGFNMGAPFLFLQVMWAIGFSMVCMAGIAQLPSRVVLSIGIAIVALHPLAAAASAGATGGAAVIRHLLLVPTVFTPRIFLGYPALPWLGVMCLGFGMAPLFRQAPAARDRGVFMLAIGLLALFAALRLANGFGDPVPWTTFPAPERTAMSFMNVMKYPPSLDYVAVTLGISMLLFLALTRLQGWLRAVLLDFGRTPLFTYVAHIYIAHGIAFALAAIDGRPDAVFGIVEHWFVPNPPAPWSYSLPAVYGVWLVVLAILVPLSHWFAGVKRRRRDWWLSYL